MHRRALCSAACPRHLPAYLPPLLITGNSISVITGAEQTTNPATLSNRCCIRSCVWTHDIGCHHQPGRRTKEFRRGRLGPSKVWAARVTAFPRRKVESFIRRYRLYSGEQRGAYTHARCSAKTVRCTRAKCFGPRGHTEIPDSRHHLSSMQLSTSGADERHR